nr:seminal plasma protein HSP-1-like isoform X3 [Zootoca vivipara]
MWFITQLLVCTWVLFLPSFSAARPDVSSCVFPFIYKNKTYHTCTKDGSKLHRLWCATTSSYDKDHHWKSCYETEYGGNSHGKPCVFPFVYKGRLFYTCTDEEVMPRKFWCATTRSYDIDGKWSYCADTIIGKSKSDVTQERAYCDPAADPHCLVASRGLKRLDNGKHGNILPKEYSRDEDHEKDQEMTIQDPASSF